MPQWEAITENGPILDPKVQEDIPLVRDTKQGIIDALNYLFCSSKHKSTRICAGCYEINFYGDITYEWSGEIRVQTIISK